MIKIRIHGRGGQGNVTLGQLIAMAAFYDGKMAQAFPNFGVERKGAPVFTYVKIDKQFIKSRQQIYNPDFIIIQDPGLINIMNVFEGAKKNAVVVINSNKMPGEICPRYTGKVYCVPVLEIALRIIGKPIINTSMLGVFAKISGLITLNSSKKAISVNLGEKFDQDIINKNIRALEEAYKSTEI
jgi:pyruvate ferredoxin oxidoreductase gamma subunit